MGHSNWRVRAWQESNQLSAIGGVFVVLNQPHSNPVQPTPTAGEAES